jgi:hypothetical protein
MAGDPTRLQIFVDARLLAALPTRRQLRQAELEMTPYVLSTDATSEDGYRDRLLSHPVVRQALILPHVGLDHVRTGAALGARLESLCAHLIVTFHRGMPVFDLQLVQTHPGGLARLRRAIEDTLAGADRARWRLASTLLRDPAGYLARFLGRDGYIARAERFDYPGPAAEHSAFPPEFFSLVRLASHALTFPDERVSPRRALFLLSRRFREGGRLGWISD